ncbi:hypothetical protein MBLNU459_g4115t3 [Dothideomycetes sp. NU459]
MPRTRQVDVAHPSPVSHPLRPFVFPAGHHLVIATPCGIYSWDSTGLVQIFNSSKKGILAAKEANDGSQLLAVADKHNVVLHDCKRERNESWGLIGDEGQVRLLEYAPDAKSLFLSTSLTGAIQCYSMHESRLLDPAQTHPTPPTVLAVSSATHLMLSASDDPPVVYLQNLTLKTPALQLHPSASSAAVVAASFHPQRPNVFLLAFKDGTLAAYDATQMARRNGARMDVNATIETNGRAGEIAHLSKLHRITTRAAVDPNRVLDAAALGGDDDGTKTAAVGSKSMGITGAAFLTGYRSRALSVGGDGRCRLVDFEGGGKILRTWHAQAPVTSLSILAVEEERGAGIGNVDGMGAPGRRQRRATANNLIAVGRADGKVCLFDSVGLKLDMMVIDNAGERVISVEWIKGPSPKAMSSLPIEEMAEGVKANPTKAIRLAGQTDVPLQYETASGLPSALQGSILQSLANTSKLLAEPVMTGALPPDNPATSSNKHGDCSRQHPDFPPNAEELDVRSGANPTSFKRAEHVQAAKIVLEDSPDAQKKPLKARLTHYTTAPLVLPPSQAAIAAPSSGLNVGEEEVNAEGKVSAASGRVHSPKATRPWLAKQVLSATSDEGMTTAREYISPVDQAFSPESTEVRQLFPRSSSLSPRREKSAVGAEKGNSENRDGRAKLAVLGHNTINARRKQPEDLERQNAATAAAFALLGSAKAPSRPGAATKPCRGPPGGVPAALNASLPGPSDPPRSQPQKGHKAHSASARHATTKQQSQPQPGTRATTTTQSKRPTTSFVDGAPTIAGTDFGLPRDERGLVHDTMSDAAPAARRDECDACPALRAQVRDLDDQVARLRAEVLGLRTRLRRVGG